MGAMKEGTQIIPFTNNHKLLILKIFSNIIEFKEILLINIMNLS